MIILIAITAVGLNFLRISENKKNITIQNDFKIQKKYLFEKIYELKGKSLKSFAYDYTYWDEMVDFINKETKHIYSNWPKQQIEPAVPTYNFQVIWIYNKFDKLVYSLNLTKISTVDSLPINLKSFRSKHEKNLFVHFFIPTNKGFIEFQSAPIQPTSDNKRITTPLGYMFAGRIWNNEYINDFRNLCQTEISTSLLKESSEDTIVEESKGIINFSKTLYGWDLKPVGHLNIKAQSEFIQTLRSRSESSMLYTIVFVIICLSFIAFFIIYLIRKPLSILIKSLKTENTDILEKIEKNKSDFGHIARLIKRFFNQKKEIEAEIVERKKIEIDLLKTKEEAENANTAKSAFLATMSHEIRTPMNGVIGMTGLLLRTNQTKEQKEFTETIKLSGESLMYIINDILDFSKIEANKVELEEEPFELNNFIEEILDLLTAKRDGKKIELSYFIDPKIPKFIIGDSSRLRQILVNLIGNAQKFTEKGEIFLEVKEINQIKNSNVILEFSIKDTGIGIPKEKQHFLFDAFSQVDSSTRRKYGGTGLGLAISKKLVELLGGNICVESEVGFGSKFTFTIATSYTMPGNVQYITNYNKNIFSDKLIAIIDDKKTNCEILFNQCQYWGMIPFIFENIDGFINHFKSEPSPDLVLINVYLDVTSTNTIISSFRNYQKFEKLPLIITTPKGNFEDENHTNQLFFYKLVKPLKFNQLLATFKVVLETQFNPDTKEYSNMHSIESLYEKYPLTILVAEDNHINQVVVKRFLEKLGYSPQIVSNGFDVMNSLSEKHFDIIFMDLQMPDMDGFETTEKIFRELDIEVMPIIIAMTANVFKEDKENCFKVGMQDFVGKPIQFEEIQNALIKWSKILKEKK